MGQKTKREQKVFLFNLFCKDIKGIEEIRIKTLTSFVNLDTIFLLLEPQFFSFINEGIGLFIY